MTTTTTQTATPSLQLVKPADIATHHRNPRKTVGDVTDLVASVQEHGILEPLVVAVWPDGVSTTAANKRKHLLIAGHRRLAAAKEAKLAEVPVIVREDLDTEAKQLEAMLVENLHRADLTPVEEAEAYQTLLEFPGFTQTKLAKDVGQPVSRIRDRLKLTKLQPVVRDRIHTGQISITDALAVDEFADDEKTVKQLLKVAGSRDFRFTLERARRERENNRQRQERIDAFTQAGYAVLKHDGYGDPKGWKSLRDLFEPGRFFNRDDIHKELAWAAKVHKDCEHATALVRPYEIVLGCGKASAHPKPKVKKTKAQLAAEAKEKAAAKELETNLTAAAAARRAFLRAVATQTATPGLAKARLLDLVLNPTEDTWYDERGVKRRQRVLAEVLDVDLTDVADEDVQSRLTTALSTLDVAGLVVLLDVSIHAGREDDLTGRYPHVGHGGALDGWILTLDAGYGYAWSEFERGHFKAVLDPQPLMADALDAEGGEPE